MTTYVMDDPSPSDPSSCNMDWYHNNPGSTRDAELPVTCFVLTHDSGVSSRNGTDFDVTDNGDHWMKLPRID